MRDDIDNLLNELTARHADRRLHVFQVNVESLDGDKLKLAGRLLEQDNLDALREALRARFPSLQVDDSSIRILRRLPAAMLTVATNLTDLHVADTFLCELLTQFTNGVRLEVLEEKDRWRFVRQDDGYLGWAFTSYLTADAAPGPATHMVQAPIAKLFATPPAENDAPMPPATRLVAGTRVRVVEHSAGGAWSRIEPVGRSIPGGWTKSHALLDLAMLPLDPAAARTRMLDHARRLTGTCYLWGGCSAFGIDCSGLAQLVHRLCGYELPRDADMQFAAGRPIPGDGGDARPGDLLFFSETGKKITHVAVSTGGWNIIHSSRFHNGVYEDDVRQRPHLRDTFAGARTFL
jgi:cell wall-associated NlpC family hydrolase